MSVDALRSLVDSLPQRPLVADATIDRWLDRTQAVDPGRVDWHIRRCRGFGGSDIGTMVRGFRGMPMDGFSTDREIVQSKLMLRSPDAQNGHTRRGTILEPLIRDLFLARYKAKPRTDVVDAMQKHFSPEHPWLVGNPDEVAEMPDGSIWVVDYKSPTPRTIKEYQEKDGVSFDYSAQVHQMQLIAEESSKVKIAGRLLCSFDIMEGDIDVRFIEYDADLMTDILRAGDYYWQEFVMKGLLPDLPNRAAPLELVDPRMQSKLEAISDELINSHALATVSYAHAAALKERLSATIGSYGELPVGKHTLACSVIVSQSVVDTDEVSRLLVQHDKTLEDFVTKTETGVLDVDRITNYLLESGMTKDDLAERFGVVTQAPDVPSAIEFLRTAGEDTSRCEKTVTTVEISKSRKGAVADVMADRKDMAKGVLSRYLLSRATVAQAPAAGVQTSAAPAKKIVEMAAEGITRPASSLRAIAGQAVPASPAAEPVSLPAASGSAPASPVAPSPVRPTLRRIAPRG